ncbi:MAG: OmpA family protein [Flavobacteriales bacterium]
MKKTLALLILSGSLFNGLQAQEEITSSETSGKLNTWSLGIHAGHVYDLPTSIFASQSYASDVWGLRGGDTKFDVGYGIYVEKQFSPILGLQLGYDMADITSQNKVDYVEGEFSNISLTGTINFSNFTLKRERSKWGFYGKLGASAISFKAQRYFVDRGTPEPITGEIINTNTLQKADKTRLKVHTGLGLRYHFSSNFRAELESVGNWVFSEDFDGDALAVKDGNGAGDMYLYTSIGIAYTFGSGRSMHEVSKNSKDYFWNSDLAQDNNKTDEDYIKGVVDESLAGSKAEIKANEAELARLKAELDAQKALLEQYKNSAKNENDVKAIQAQAFQVYFATGSDYVNEEYQKVLTQLGAVLKENPSLNAEVTGFTDSRGSESVNSKLRDRRAKAVQKFLTKNVGIAKNRISTSTSTSNISGGDDIYHLNRKVEILLK